MSSLHGSKYMPNRGLDSTGAQFAGPLPHLPMAIRVYIPIYLLRMKVLTIKSGAIDTLGWLNKGFCIQTGPRKQLLYSLSATMHKGGGNDWALG